MKIIKNEDLQYDKASLLKKIKTYFKKKDYIININELEKLNFDQLINTLCMISPLTVEEKQKLIETNSINEKIKIFENIINFSLVDNFENTTIQ